MTRKHSASAFIYLNNYISNDKSNALKLLEASHNAMMAGCVFEIKFTRNKMIRNVKTVVTDDVRTFNHKDLQKYIFKFYPEFDESQSTQQSNDEQLKDVIEPINKPKQNNSASIESATVSTSKDNKDIISEVLKRAEEIDKPKSNFLDSANTYLRHRSEDVVYKPTLTKPVAVEHVENTEQKTCKSLKSTVNLSNNLPKPEPEMLCKYGYIPLCFNTKNDLDSVKRVLKTNYDKEEFTGIYLIFNDTNKKWYVGQGKRAIKRCFDHFKYAKSRPDKERNLFEDYENGNQFYVNFVHIKDSPYDTLDELEKVYINRYNCVSHGYNTVKGNGK